MNQLKFKPPSTQKLVTFVLLACIFLSHDAFARPFDSFSPQDLEEILVTADDGVVTTMTHLKNPGKPLLLMETSLCTRDVEFELLAKAFRDRGDFDIFIGNSRGASQLSGEHKKFGESNGLTEVSRKDLPAQMRYILRSYASPEQKKIGLSFFGHSMGGMILMGALSNDGLRAEFKPYIKSIVLLQSPYSLHDLKLPIRMLAAAGIPLLRILKKYGVQAIHLNPGFESDSPDRYLTPAAREIVYKITRWILAPAHSDAATLRHTLPDMPAYSVPVDVLWDFADAANRRGQFLDSRGERLIKPELLADLPVMALRSNLDSLASWSSIGEFFSALATQSKLLVSIENMNHLDTVLFTDPNADFISHVVDFLRDPIAKIKDGPELVFAPKCADLLTKVKMRFRRKGL